MPAAAGLISFAPETVGGGRKARYDIQPLDAMKTCIPAKPHFGRSPGAALARTPVPAILSVLCLLSLAGMPVSCGTADPFYTESELSTTVFLPDLLALDSHPTRAGFSDIERLDIFVFDDDGGRRLDSYSSSGRPETPYVSVTSGAGDKLVVALANCTGKSFTYDEFSSYEALESVVWRLKDEDPERPVMSGECQISAGAEGYTPLKLTPLLSGVTLDFLKCDFSGRGYRSRTLENCCVYLTNISGSAEILRQDGFRVSELENPGWSDPSFLATMKHPEMVYSEVTPGQWSPVNLYCYPNDASDGMPGSPHTRMVVQGDIDGVTYYYPVDINQDGFGYASGPHGLSRNVKYSYSLLVTRKGSTDPGTPLGPEEAVGEGWIKIYPGQFLTGTNGEKLHIWVEVYPEDTPVDFCREDLDFDVERGIYTYEMDPDGHGVVLTLCDDGTGMFTVDAGAPVNDGFLVIVVVNP